MTKEELRKTYPEYTVFILERDNKICRVNTSEYYIAKNKSWDECIAAVKQMHDYRVKQDKDLFEVTLLKEQEEAQYKQKISLTEIIDRLEGVYDSMYDIRDTVSTLIEALEEKNDGLE